MEDFDFYNQQLKLATAEHKKVFGIEPDLETNPDPDVEPWEYTPQIIKAIKDGKPFIANEHDDIGEAVL